MKITLHEIPVREVFDGFRDDAENGVVGYGGRLNIRPAFQREFVYDDKERNAVISSMKKGFPLNVMYWAKNGDDSYELMDGQQRTISICRYLDNIFEHDGHLFAGLTETEQLAILDDYKLMIYICEGTDKEKLEWFRIINIAGKPLTPQELRNAVYTGEWLTDAKQYFSRSGCAAQKQAKDYLAGKASRQEYLETALKWIADRDGKTIETYMAEHQMDSNASELWLYFDAVISWVKTLFPKYRKEMQGVEWGLLYNKYKDDKANPRFDPKYLEQRVSELMQDDDVTNQKGIYRYLLSGEEKHLQIRAFTPTMKRAAYERQGAVCYECKKPFDISEMEAHHIIPWAKGGPTSADNCRMLCVKCHHNEAGK